jgi:starch-binding outer membrane protein, SusD/RagB family
MNTQKRNIMSYNKKIFNTSSLTALAALLAFGLGSCSKSFVNKQPTTAVSFATALSSASALQSDLYSTYAELRLVDQYGRDWPVIGDLMADNTFLESDNSGRYISQFGYTVSSTDNTTTSIWSDSYNGILQTNQIIDANVAGTDEIKAQAYALRGLLYFKLVNMFAQPYTTNSTGLGVPIVLHYDVTATPGRNTVAEVYTQIISDLKKGFATAPAYTTSSTLSKYAIEGLLARAYMYMGDYANALTAATEVINNGPFSLTPYGTYAAFWSNAFTRVDPVEVMYEVDCDVFNNNGFDDLGGIYINGYQDIYCSKSLALLYSGTDDRATVLIPGTTKRGAPAYLVNKYPNAQNSDRDNIKVIRLSEVYLIAAEAAQRTGDEATAQTMLATLLAQRDPSLDYSADSGPTLLADIILERRKELAFEGDRLYDLNRLGQPINRTTNSGSAQSGNGLAIPFPSNKRVAPIPLQETLRNPTIATQQNPGY